MENVERCGLNLIHRDIVEKVRENMPEEDIIINLADLYKALSDTTRLKILNALYFEEMCVCDIAGLIGMSQSATSHQLRVLKQAELVKNRKEGKIVYYSLIDNHVKEIFNQGINHIKEKK